MRKICSQGVTFLLLVLLLSLGACQEFIHNSFDTFTGRIVDKEGNPVVGLELIVTQDLDFGVAQAPVAKSIIYKVKTTIRGEFRVVVPSRTDISFNTKYFLLLTAPVQFEMEDDGMSVLYRYYSFSTAGRDTEGMIDLGTLKIVRE
ncbi:MAG: hypothetical protein NBV61_04470 [Algoriphagus sp.]|nr:hypothetical protein [Algoriphagus sp.]